MKALIPDGYNGQTRWVTVMVKGEDIVFDTGAGWFTVARIDKTLQGDDRIAKPLLKARPNIIELIA